MPPRSTNRSICARCGADQYSLWPTTTIAPYSSKNVRFGIEIVVREIIERDAFAFRPGREQMFPFVHKTRGAIVRRRPMCPAPIAISRPGFFAEIARPQIDETRHICRRRHDQRRKRPLVRQHADGAFHCGGELLLARHQRSDIAIGVRTAPPIIGVIRVGREYERSPAREPRSLPVLRRRNDARIATRRRSIADRNSRKPNPRRSRMQAQPASCSRCDPDEPASRDVRRDCSRCGARRRHCGRCGRFRACRDHSKPTRGARSFRRDRHSAHSCSRPELPRQSIGRPLRHRHAQLGNFQFPFARLPAHCEKFLHVALGGSVRSRH